MATTTEETWNESGEGEQVRRSMGWKELYLKEDGGLFGSDWELLLLLFFSSWKGQALNGLPFIRQNGLTSTNFGLTLVLT